MLFEQRRVHVVVETRGSSTPRDDADRPATAQLDRPAPNCTLLTASTPTAGFDVIVEAIATSATDELLPWVPDRTRRPGVAFQCAVRVGGMRAAVMRDWQLRVDDIADPTPGTGSGADEGARVRHLRQRSAPAAHGEESRALTRGAQRRVGLPTRWRRSCSSPSGDMVMGHEFCCEVVDLGAGCDNLNVGDVIVGMPVAFDAHGHARRSASPTPTTAATPS